MFLYLGMQMAARGRGRDRGRGRGANAPISVEELMHTQNEMMYAFLQHLQHQSAAPPPPVYARDVAQMVEALSLPLLSGKQCMILWGQG